MPCSSFGSRDGDNCTEVGGTHCDSSAAYLRMYTEHQQYRWESAVGGSTLCRGVRLVIGPKYEDVERRVAFAIDGPSPSARPS